MSPPVPQINTFLENKSRPVIEPISKIFIFASLILGINRFPLISTNTYFKSLALCYSILFNIFCLSSVIVHVRFYDLWALFLMGDYFKLLICTILEFILLNKLRTFYRNLNNYDKEIGINETHFGTRECVYNFLQLIVTISNATILYCVGGYTTLDLSLFLHLMLTKLINCFELHYCGHLFCLLIPRLTTLKDFIENYFPNNNHVSNCKVQSENIPLNESRPSYQDSRKLMNLYSKMITVYDSLYAAIKWQMLILLVTTFSVALCSAYGLVNIILSGDAATDGMLLGSTSLMSMHLLPFLVPCIFADRLQNEVRLIKEFLSCKLYKSSLDKPSRRTMRTMIALIDTRDLSFSLFHMFDIDTSLPFKFLALLLTYLIILLQFDKIISPT